MEHIKQDYLEGELATKTTVELKELLERQEKLSKKTKFLRSLPDGGSKVLTMVEKLRSLLSERQSNITSPEQMESPLINNRLMSAELSEQQNTIERVADLEILQSKPTRKPLSKFSKQNIRDTNSKTSNIDSKPSFNLFLKEESEFASETNDLDTKLETGNNNAECVSKIEQVSLDELEKQYDRMNIGPDSDYRVKCLAEEHILNRIERTHNNRKRELLKLNRDLKISKVEELPPWFRYHGKKETERCTFETVAKHPPKKISSLWENTAVCPPSYKFSIAKDMSIQESLKRQEDQNKRREEIQAVYAAEKLAEKLHINMETFYPDRKDMSYREPEPIGSDDDLEGVD